MQTRLRLGQYDEAVRAAAEFQDIFGRDSYYVELMDHGLGIEKRVYEDLVRLSKDIGAPLLATNDLHYTRREDSHAHEALLCVQSGSTLDEPTYENGGKRFALSGDGYYVKSAEEMWALWGDRHPEALTNTLVIAEQCEVTFNTAADFMPRYDCPPGEDEHSWFVKEVQAGLAPSLRRGDSRRRPGARRVRDRGHRGQGLPRILPGSRRLCAMVKGPGDPRWVRAAAPGPARWPPMRWASRTWTR